MLDFVPEFKKLRNSTKALTVPLTYLILLVSTLLLVSVTYYFAVDEINTRAQSSKVSLAQENMITLDNDIMSVVWQPGSSRTFEFQDCGGQFVVDPSENVLQINITDNNNISTCTYDSSVGWTIYELPYSEDVNTGLFLKGNSQVVLNQTESTIDQLSIQQGNESSELLLQYRPRISSIVLGVEDNRTINDVRIYVVNLNSSSAIAFGGAIPLLMTCENVQSFLTSFNVSYQPSFLLVSAALGGSAGQVSVPVSSAGNGSIINIELVECSVKIDRWIR